MNPNDFKTFKEKLGKFRIRDIFEDLFNSSEKIRTGKSPRRKHWCLILLLTLVILFIYFFIQLPSLSPYGYELYFFIVLGLAIFWGLMILFGRKPKNFLGLKISVVIALFCLLFPTVMTFIGSPIFFSRQYSKIIQPQLKEFSDEIEQISLNQVPVLDREAAGVIGEKQMGSVGDLVSQFDIAQNYSQVNLAGKPIRVSPLQYTDLFKYLTNNKNGLEYYVSVDMTTQEGDLVKLENPIYYSESDILLRDLDRHLRFQHPFSLFGETNFEIDDDGNAWYVTPKLVKRIAMFNGTDSVGVYLTNANTGESTYYAAEEIPEWVDRAQPSEYIIQQLDWYGLYKDGYINSVLGQKNVTSTTEGYNYISLGTDIYLITGVTSVRADTSNLGFYYVNLRTKEASFYSVPSATETAAMQSARGKVQEKNYTPTFPVILNIQGRPVYFMSLKDQSLTAKMFALVDAENFTEVVVGNTVREVMALYFEQNPNTIDPEMMKESYVKLKIDQVQAVVEEGNTIYYFLVNGQESIFRADPEVLGPKIAFIKEGDEVEFYFQENEGIATVLSMK